MQQPSAADGCERVVGEGRKARLGGAPDADILREAIAELHERTMAGATMFLIKVKECQGESANEADGIRQTGLFQSNKFS